MVAAAAPERAPQQKRNALGLNRNTDAPSGSLALLLAGRSGAHTTARSSPSSPSRHVRSPGPSLWAPATPSLACRPNRDTIYDGGLQATAQIELGRRLGSNLAVGLGLQIARESGMGDCIPGFTVCARHLEYERLSAIVSWKPQLGLPLLSAGLGTFRLPESPNGPTPRAYVLGIHLGAEFPLIRIKRLNWFSLGLRGTILPNPPGPAIYSVELALGFRHWFAESPPR